MPQGKLDYKNGKIYGIYSYQTDKVYIGSTCSRLCKRLYQHRADYNRFNNGKYRFVSSFDILQYDDHYIELVEEFPCENSMQLRKREGEIIRSTENCINKYVAGRDQKCIHDRQRSRCKDCGGGSICMHDKERPRCKDCGGVSVQKIKCGCGAEIQKQYMKKHKETKKHLRWADQNKEESK